MSVTREVLRFLRDAEGFARDVDPSAVALHGATLSTIVEPAIAGIGDNPLRSAQVSAFEALGALRAGLVLGPPGTGKTHLLSWLVLGHVWARVAAGLGSRVFLTAFTRSAVETLLGGVARRVGAGPCEMTLVYLGTPRSPLPPGVHCVASAHAGARELETLLKRRNVVFAGTIWGLNSAIGKACIPDADGPTAPFFDLVALDEASQMVLGQGLMALAGMAPGCRVVVAGDDRQLPPIRLSRGMKIDGREVGGSLYAFLREGGVPEFALDETFRLNAPLTAFPEKRFYPGIYRSAVPGRRLSLSPDWRDGLDELERLVLDPSLPTVVLVHDGPSAATHSPFEVELAARLLSRFRARMRTSSGDAFNPSSFWRDGMALISPHRAQNAALRARVESGDRSESFVDTIDRIQGRERDVVIMTYTVSDPEFALAEAEFIFSPERLNVAITRARSKLVVIVSRRLLEVVPPQQETLDKAEVLREFVFDGSPLADHTVQLPGLAPVRLTVRANGFGGAGAPGDADAMPSPAPLSAVPDVLDPRAEAVLAAIREVCVCDGVDSVTLQRLQQRISHRDGVAGAYAEARALHECGWALLTQFRNKFAVGTFYWRVAPLEQRRRVLRLDDPVIRDRIRQEVYRDGLPYYQVQAAFAWMSADWPGEDALRPLVDAMVAEGVLQASASRNGALLLSPALDDGAVVAEEPDPPALDDVDFLVLNALEDLEATRIASGLVEVWSDLADVSGWGGSTEEAAVSLSRLAAAGHVLFAADGRIRSRMAELAREIRFVKQRFRDDDAARRPYLVRSLKVLLRDRTKPRQDVGLETVLAAARLRHDDVDVHRALDGLGAALRAIWGPAPNLAAFQARSFAAILASWLGAGTDDAFVVAADTGSGKTEAAALPLIAGSCVDALRGIHGTRAVFAYPRVRLAANQSQRLARYLSALARMPGMPTLTLGVQFADVPSSWRMGEAEATEAGKAGWTRTGNVWSFPLFACPVPSCGSPLELHPGRGVDGADRLRCARCSWGFDGWVGTKYGLQSRPPAFFLPTMDSLHQWLQTPRYGGLFGDLKGSAPRAFLADEIHLYSHVHGAQVGYAIRRLLARCERNDASGRRCLAIGMSATLGDPVGAFGRLIGRGAVTALQPEAQETPSNPRGREYFYFIQPEVESRNRDVAGASTTIQSLMCLAHGMRRRRGRGGGFRAIAFLDSIDKVRRLHSAYDDAERGKNLPAFRTTRYADDPLTGRIRDSCCGEPASCARYVDGECWYFAATDRRQARADGKPWQPGRPLAVARFPVTSGTEGAVEEMIKVSDVVFATSSLEVGYDDPDIALVYQHYGPQNLASFIQRKGRGGRGADDRPITAVTLSIYKPRDTYWFDRPDLMLDAKGFQAPLNPDNHFVRRAQILSQFLDGLASIEARTSASPWRQDGTILPEAVAQAAAFVETVFGPEPWRAYRFASMLDLWSAAKAFGGGADPVRSAREARDALPWLPRFLHASVDLPTVDVVVSETDRVVATDVNLAFAMLAPGNVTRRFDGLIGVWRPPVAGRAPWFADDDYLHCGSLQPCGPVLDHLLAELPLAVRPLLGPGLSTDVIRPLRITLAKAGRFEAQWARWDPASEIDDQDIVGPAASPPGQMSISHESVGRLEGCAIVSADATAGRPYGPPDGRDGLVREIRVFTADPAGGGSGLSVTQVAWGAESVLRTITPGADPRIVTQTFTDPRTGRPALHGFQVETEGVRITFDEARIEGFVAGEIARPRDGSALWFRLQMARAETMLRFQARAMNRFDAERIALLVGAMASNPAFAERVARLKKFPKTGTICAMFEEVRRDHQALDPLMTQARVAKAVQAVTDEALGPLISEVLFALDDPAARARHLRSCLMHGLALRWRQLFVTLAQGDERRVGVHCRLPMLYGDTPAIVTVAETGQSGDGTTRAFQSAIPEAWERWSDGFAASCPNAEEDATVDRFLSDRSRHAEWLTLSPRDARGLDAIAAALGPGGGGGAIPASVARILFGYHLVGQETFGAYELATAVYDARAGLETRLGRPSLPWELVSDVATRAASGKDTGVLTRLFEAYAAVPDADGEGSRSTTSRFGEQIYRLGTRLCTDGCRACVQQEGGPVHGILGEATVSRTLVRRYLTCD